MTTRRNLLGAAAGTGILLFVPRSAHAADRRTSTNGWQIDAGAVATFPIRGTRATVVLRRGAAATVLIHIARRWHYEIGPLDTGEGGGIIGHLVRPVGEEPFEANHLSGTAVALHPAAYPAGGSERLWPHHESVVRDILADLEGVVVWGGDLTPAKPSHFHIGVRPGDRALATVAARLNTSVHLRHRSQTPGVVADPASPARRAKVRATARRR
jgi:hypothetical protein